VPHITLPSQRSRLGGWLIESALPKLRWAGSARLLARRHAGQMTQTQRWFLISSLVIAAFMLPPIFVDLATDLVELRFRFCGVGPLSSLSPSHPRVSIGLLRGKLRRRSRATFLDLVPKRAEHCLALHPRWSLFPASAPEAAIVGGLLTPFLLVVAAGWRSARANKPAFCTLTIYYFFPSRRERRIVDVLPGDES